MQRLCTLLLFFNKPLWLYNVFFTACALFIVIKSSLAVLPLSLLLKLVSYAGAVGFQKYFTPQIYLYYRNAGVQLRNLYLLSFMADLMLFLLILTLHQTLLAHA